MFPRSHATLVYSVIFLGGLRILIQRIISKELLLMIATAKELHGWVYGANGGRSLLAQSGGVCHGAQFLERNSLAQDLRRNQRTSGTSRHR